jgi:predicted secreted Zn-dependent protease
MSIRTAHGAGSAAVFLLKLILCIAPVCVISCALQRIVVITNPSGATVWRRDMKVGTTPCVARIPKTEDTAVIIIRKEKYEPETCFVQTIHQKAKPTALSWGQFDDNEFVRNLIPSSENPLREKFIFLKRVSSLDSVASPDVIIWDQTRKLVYEDFQAQAPSISRYSGYTTLDLACYYAVTDGKIRVRLASQFFKRLSWLKSPLKRENKGVYELFRFPQQEELFEYVLNHEQRHFDIAEIYARSLRDSLQKTMFDSVNFERKLSEIVVAYNRSLVAIEERYDRECGRGYDVGTQVEWDNIVERKLSASQAGLEFDIPLQQGRP